MNAIDHHEALPRALVFDSSSSRAISRELHAIGFTSVVMVPSLAGARTVRRSSRLSEKLLPLPKHVKRLHDIARILMQL
jgi:hypothetical protein